MRTRGKNLDAGLTAELYQGRQRAAGGLYEMARVVGDPLELGGGERVEVVVSLEIVDAVADDLADLRLVWNTSWSPTLHQRLAGVPSSGSIICSRTLSSDSGGSLTLRTEASSVKMMGRYLSAGGIGNTSGRDAASLGDAGRQASNAGAANEALFAAQPTSATRGNGAPFRESACPCIGARIRGRPRWTAMRERR